MEKRKAALTLQSVSRLSNAVMFSELNSLISAESSYEAQSRLEAVLLKNYSNSIRPVLSYKDNVTVTVGISLSRIQDLVSVFSLAQYRH